MWMRALYSGSHEAGIRPGDWIVSVAGVEVSSEALREVPTKKLRYASCLLEEVG